MPMFRINLIRERPVPLPQRRPMALALLLYILAAGGILAWTIFQAVHDVLASRLQARLVVEQNRSFLAMHKGWPSVDAYANSLRSQMNQSVVTLSTVEQLQRQRLPVAHILRDLAAPLTNDAQILNIDINPAASALRFDLAVPVDDPGGSTNTAAILSAWKNAPFLKRFAADLREGSSQQTDLKGRPVFLLHFEASLQGGI